MDIGLGPAAKFPLQSRGPVFFRSLSLARAMLSVANEDIRDVTVLKEAPCRGWHSMTGTRGSSRLGG